MDVYAAGSLYSLPSILDSATSLGLHEGTLYDVLNIDAVPGNATVNASGFNVTCGYVADRITELQSSGSDIWKTAENPLYEIHATRKQDHSTWNGGMSHQLVEPGMISTSRSPISPPSFFTAPFRS
jgi:hypothetical protein